MSVKEFVTAYGDSAFQRREEVVRCRDCRFFEETGNCTWFECGTCGTQGEVTGDGFCAWGERRDA